MDFLSAAQKILEKEGGPIHYREITKRALAQGLISPTGMTPDATMGSRLYVDTKKETSRFVRHGKGRFSLKRQSQQDEIAKRVEEINDRTRQVLRRRLHELPADRFEALIGELLIGIGFEESSVQVTSYSNDGGIDVRGVMNAGDVTTINVAVQVKRWKKNVQANVIRELRGSLTTHEQGIIITTSDYSTGARTEANAIGKTPISLVNGYELIELLIKHSIGINKEPHTVYTLDEEWWNEAGIGTELDSLDERPVEPKIHNPEIVPVMTFPLLVRAINNPEIQGVLVTVKGEMQFQDAYYITPSAAGKDASGWKSCNGWRFWQYQHPVTKEWRLIDELRQKPQ
jgi:hypothetical protein